MARTDLTVNAIVEAKHVFVPYRNWATKENDAEILMIFTGVIVHTWGSGPSLSTHQLRTFIPMGKNDPLDATEPYRLVDFSGPEGLPKSTYASTAAQGAWWSTAGEGEEPIVGVDSSRVGDWGPHGLVSTNGQPAWVPVLTVDIGARVGKVLRIPYQVTFKVTADSNVDVLTNVLNTVVIPPAAATPT